MTTLNNRKMNIKGVDERFRDFATVKQWEYYVASIEYGSGSKAAKALGLHKSTVCDSVTRMKKKAAIQGYAPDFDMVHQTAPGYAIKGTSTLYKDGEVSIQWVKTQKERADQLADLAEAMDLITEGVKPIRKVKAPKSCNKDLMTVYPMGDPHIGMYAWAKETGQDFDCDIARSELYGAMKYLSDQSPNSETAMIVNLGDFFHADDSSNTTARSNNALDVDTRWARVLELGILAMIDCINLAAAKHKKVIVINAIGNHDDHSSVMLSIALKAWFRNEPRVDIRDTIAKHDYILFGKVLIGVTHGDTIKRKAVGMDAVMATDRPDYWAASTKRYWYTGHIHSDNKEELTGVLWESFRNLAPNDSWHQQQGYRSGQDMKAIVHHKNHGEVSRLTCDISMIRG